MGWRTLRTLSRHLGLTALPRLRRTPGETSIWVGGHPMVIWMWCLPPMDDRDGGPLRADVSMFRFPTARIYIVCLLASRLLYWIQMFSGLGILVAPRSSTFRVVLGGISASTSSYLVKKSCLTLLNSCGFVNCRTLTHQCPCLQDDESKRAAAGEPDAGRGF